MEELKTCYECGRVLEAGEDYEIVNNEIVCCDCFDEYYCYCDECGNAEHIDNTQYIDDKIICDDCLDRYYVTCANCNEYIHIDDGNSTIDGTVCDYCYNEYYVECHECGEIIHHDDSVYCDYNEEYYCRECYDEYMNNCTIHDYGYKPEPYFYGNSDKLYMGIELEIDGAGEKPANAGELLEIDGEDRIYCKHDGSLDDGFEIVSHPATLEYHIYNMQWSRILEHALYMGYKSHDAGTCGLHIHISRNALGDCYDQQERTVAKILYFIEKHWQKMLVFSRRTQYQLDRWASRYGILDEELPEDILKRAKSGCGRYKAVNLQNYNTIEFRFFRGTLKHTTFIATLQFVHNICNYCINTNNSDLYNARWSDFVKTVTDIELLTYLENRGILED